MYFRTPFNYNFTDEKMELNNEPSLTTPDETVTVREMLEKYVRGIPPAISRHVEYDVDPSLDDVDPLNSLGFDLADSQGYADTLESNYDALNRSKNELLEKSKAQNSPTPQKTDESDA